MSDNAILTALRRMGFAKEEVTGHGFRATARTLLAERLDVPPDVIEAQLAHAVGDSLGRAYNRTQFLEQRRRMMSIWADYLDTLRDGVVKNQPGGRRSTLNSRSAARSGQKLEAVRSGNRMSRTLDRGPGR